MSVEEKLLGIITAGLILGVFFGMFLFVFRNVNFLSCDDEKENEKENKEK